MTQRGELPSPVILDGPASAAGEPAFVAALSLSLVTRRPVRFEWHTGGASAAHVGYLRALAELSNAKVEGAEPGSQALAFSPRAVRPGSYTVELPAGEPASRGVEALVLPLALAGGQSTLVVRGATHVPGAPSFHDLALAWVPALERVGLAAELSLDAAGFSSAGAIRVRVFPAPKLRPLEIMNRGVLLDVQALACIANVGIGFARQLERRASDRLRARGIAATVEAVPMPAEREKGLALVIAAHFERVRVSATAVGEAGRSAESVADEAVDRLQQLLERRGAVDARLGVQLLAPTALAASAFGAPGAIGPEARARSRYTVSEVTPELLEVADVARRLLDVEVQVQGLPGNDGLVEVRPRP